MAKKDFQEFLFIESARRPFSRLVRVVRKSTLQNVLWHAVGRERSHVIY